MHLLLYTVCTIVHPYENYLDIFIYLITTLLCIFFYLFVEPEIVQTQKTAAILFHTAFVHNVLLVFI